MQELPAQRYGLAFITCNDPYSLLMQWYAGTDYTAVALFYPSTNGIKALVYNVYDDQTPFWITEEGEMDMQSIASCSLVSKVSFHCFPPEMGELEIKRYRQAILSLTLERRACKELTLEYHKELLHSLALGVMGLDPNSGYNRANSVIRQCLVPGTHTSLTPTIFTPSHPRREESSKSKELSLLLTQAFTELIVEDDIFASKILSCRRSILKLNSEVSQLGVHIQKALDEGVLAVERLSSSYNHLARSFHLPLLVDQTPYAIWVLQGKEPISPNYLLPFSGGEMELRKMGDGALNTILLYLRDVQTLDASEKQGSMINAILEEQGRRSSKD